MDNNILKDKIEKLVNHYKIGNFEHVIKESEILLKKLHNNTFLINLIGSSYQGLGNFKMAIKAFDFIINLDKKNIAAYNNLGNVYKTLLKYNEAKENYEKALSINPNFIESVANLGNLYFELNKYEKAISQMKKAISLDGSQVKPHYNLGLIYQSTGDFEKSLNELNKVLELDPSNTNADKLISRNTKYSKESDHLKQMESKLKNLKLNEIQKINLYFSIGKAYEDIKDYDKSFEYLKKGNDSKKKLLNFSLENDLKTFKELKIFFKNYKFEKKINEKHNKKIIFIVGLPRSGTSLIEQIMSSHSKVYGCGELPFINRMIRNNFYNNNGYLDISKLNSLEEPQIINLSNIYLGLVKNFNDNSEYFTDKAPMNFAWIGIIKMLFPNSKIIHCQRDPKDNILSLYKNNFDDSLDYTYNFDDLFLFYKEYLELMKFWTNSIPNQIFDANYEKIINDPENEIKKLLNFCELEFESNCLKFYETKRAIKTVSSNQARQPLYSSSISSYRKYEKQMKDIFTKIDNLR